MNVFFFKFYLQVPLTTPTRYELLARQENWDLEEERRVDWSKDDELDSDLELLAKAR